MTDIERVARAICTGASEVMPDDVRRDCESLCEMCLAEATAAIATHTAALHDAGMVIVPREPTEAMYTAGCEELGGGLDCEDTWKAMIAQAGK